MKTCMMVALIFLVGCAACSSNVVGASAPTVSVVTPTASSTATPLPSATPTPTLTTTPTLTPTATLPVSYYITDMYHHKQELPLDCEAAAAVDFARYFDVEINEYDFQYTLPVSDNPNLGFVGYSNSLWGQVPPYAYGVHAGPIADHLNQYGMPAQSATGFTLEQLKREIAAGRPVIVWVIGNVEGGVPFEYTDKAGNKVIVAAYEHVVTVIGYDEVNIRYYNNKNMYEIPYKYFEQSWAVLGNMVVFRGE
jgi:uncharacterized protein YvpB